MVHLRVNDPNVSPNPDVNFIRALPGASQEEALKRLKAVAAQFRPVTRKWGFQINSLEEYEYNKEFVGRNWNAGEVIELVLRRKDGSFLPIEFVMYVMAHELAHIKHMNHSKAFQAINNTLRDEVKQLRLKKYYGDGFWSAGRVLENGQGDSPWRGGMPFPSESCPDYTCGGAMSRTKKRTRRRKVVRKRKREFPGEGNQIDSSDSSFRKRARSKKANELRALAAERRLQAMKKETEEAMKPIDVIKPESLDPKREKDESDVSEYESDVEIVEEKTYNDNDQELRWLRDDVLNGFGSDDDDDDVVIIG